MNIKTYIRDIPNYPQKGIIFKDITVLLKTPNAFAYVINILSARYMKAKIKKIVGIESRGFIFGSALANKLNIGFVPIRKSGKLPYKKYKQKYSLEYGTDEIEIHKDSVEKDEKIVLIDDLIATGGTALASLKLLEKLSPNIYECAFVINLSELGGLDRIKSTKTNTFFITSY